MVWIDYILYMCSIDNLVQLTNDGVTYKVWKCGFQATKVSEYITLTGGWSERVSASENVFTGRIKYITNIPKCIYFVYFLWYYLDKKQRLL